MQLSGATGVEVAAAAAAAGVTFLALGDWGWNDESVLKTLAAGLRTAAATTSPCNHASSDATGSMAPPSFVVAMGDNFYPDGIKKVSDERVAQWQRLFAPTPDALPWLVVPGNHDYSGFNGIQAQLQLSDDVQHNPWLKWCMGSIPLSSDVSLTAVNNKGPQGLPAPPAKKLPPPPRLTAAAACRSESTVTPSSTPSPHSCGPRRVTWGKHRFPLSGCVNNSYIDVFLLDTNATQYSIRSRHPTLLTEDWPLQMQWLRTELTQSQAKWKVVIGHHTLFTVGRGHQDEARCLRGTQYTTVTDPYTVRPGMGLLDVLHQGRADTYLCGHEHWFAAATDTRGEHTVHSFVCGNSVERRLWKGRYQPKSDGDYSEADDVQLTNLALHLKDGMPHGAEENNRQLAHELRLGSRLTMDANRSLFSTQTHVTQDFGDELGILRVNANADRLLVQHLSLTGTVLYSSYIQK